MVANSKANGQLSAQQQMSFAGDFPQYCNFGSVAITQFVPHLPFIYQDVPQQTGLEFQFPVPAYMEIKNQQIFPPSLNAQSAQSGVKMEAELPTPDLGLNERNQKQYLMPQNVKLENNEEHALVLQGVKMEQEQPHLETKVTNNIYPIKKQENQQPNDSNQKWDSPMASKEEEYNSPSYNRRGRLLTSAVALQRFRQILSEAPQATSQTDLMKIYKKQLQIDLRKEARRSGQDVEAYEFKEIDAASRNITQKYLRLFKLALQLLDPNITDYQNIEKLRNMLSFSKSTISTVMNVYREPSMQFFADFLRNEIITEEKFPKFIMALPIRPAEKLIMLRGIKGMIFAINNPSANLGSWYFDPKQLPADLSHIVNAVKDKRAGVQEVIIMLKEVNERIQTRTGRQAESSSWRKNIATRFSTIIQEAIRQAEKLGVLSKEEAAELRRIHKKASKTSSIGNIKERLGSETLRTYIRRNLINTDRLIVQTLEDPYLSCRTKLAIMESYEAFSRATVDPNTLKRWR